MVKKVFIFMFAFLLILSSGAGAGLAKEKTKYTGEQKQQMLKMIDENEKYSKETKKLLKEKVKNDIMIDAENPELLEQAYKEMNVTLEEGSKDYVFPDGSMLSISLEETPEPFRESETLNTLTGEDQKADAYPTSYTTKYITLKGDNYFWASAQFRAQVTLWYNTHSADSINKVYDWSIWTVAATYRDVTLNIARKYENVTDNISAYAYLRFTVVNSQNWSAKTHYLKLYVGKSRGTDHIAATFTDGSTNY